MVKNQIVNLTLDHSFDHNLSFKFPIGKCEHTFDIFVLKNSNDLKRPNLNKFCYLHFWPNYSNPYGTPIPKHESIWKCWDSLPCTLPHLWVCTWILVHCFNLLPFSFLNFGCEFKVRVTTIKVYMFLLGGIIGFGLVVATIYYISCWLP
jgi:hypothetical protein